MRPARIDVCSCGLIVVRGRPTISGKDTANKQFETMGSRMRHRAIVEHLALQNSNHDSVSSSSSSSASASTTQLNGHLNQYTVSDPTFTDTGAESRSSYLSPNWRSHAVVRDKIPGFKTSAGK